MPMVNGKMMSPQEYLQLMQNHLNPQASVPMQPSTSPEAPVMDENAMQRQQLEEQAPHGVDEVSSQLDPNYYNPDGTEKQNFQKLGSVMNRKQ